MERWYKGFHATGRNLAMRNLESFSKRLNYYRLGSLISHVCLETNALKKRQYYFFIGIESSQKDYIPNEILPRFEQLIMDMGFRDAGFSGYFEEISTMVDDEIEIDRILHVKRWRSQKLKSYDPHNYISKHDLVEDIDDHIEQHNQLLYWLSSYGRGTWQQFRTVCEELGLDRDGKFSGRIMRRLRSLGHIELVREGQYWFITPPCFVEINSKSDKYETILAGQRTPILLQYLVDFTQVSLEPQPYGNSPSVVRAIFGNKREAEIFIEDFKKQFFSVYIAGQASLKVASELPNLQMWETGLPSLAVVKGYYDFEQWIDNSFQPVGSPKETGMYRLTHRTDRFSHPQLTLYYDADDDTWRKGDWYGLRYLMLKRTGNKCEFHFNHNINSLTIDADVRLPDLYERSLVLASGRLPLYRNGQVIFGNISDDLASIIIHKLEAEMIEFKGI